MKATCLSGPWRRLGAAVLLMLVAACQPTVKVEAPDKPITINLNVRIEQEVRIKVTLTIPKQPDPIVKTASIPIIDPGETKAVVFTVGALVPFGEQTSVKVDVPVIKQAVGANLKVDAADTQESHVAFEGAVPVAFAFQAVQLVFDDSGEFLTTQQLPAGDAAARSLRAPRALPREERGPVFLEARGAFVRVAEEGAR